MIGEGPPICGASKEGSFEDAGLHPRGFPASPTWAALSDWGVEKFQLPAGIKRLIIFGDNDEHGAGQLAAYALAVRLAGRLEIEVRIPEKSGTDWNDVLRIR